MRDLARFGLLYLRGGRWKDRQVLEPDLARLALGSPVNYISPEEGAKRDREPGDPSRAWELWKALAMKRVPAN